MVNKEEMSEKKVKKTESAHLIDEKSGKADGNENISTGNSVAQKAPWPLITIGIVASVVVLALLVVIGWALTLSSRTYNLANGDFDMLHRGLSQNGGMPSRGDWGYFGGRRGFAKADANGVITAINGDTITVSGGGKQVTVKRTGSTMISGDKTEIAVNDTVLVIGNTATDGTVTAIRIMVRNEIGNHDVNDIINDSDIDRIPGV